ncbi:hypothetical protein SAMN05216276_100962 [Streptosporangium subroseum]|uniref:Uncharacterized protein n=1 Tax=Streptosporangium subroseum TaxID=106412 RepID=A0A239EBZ4_9ACTN|nr:hypothetical protein [Streptosporangium subroseum]SNS41991.1 hypothetical protein SAMN05216276_100962 [Streptosporangium subroseum]
MVEFVGLVSTRESRIAHGRSVHPDRTRKPAGVHFGPTRPAAHDNLVLRSVLS